MSSKSRRLALGQGKSGATQESPTASPATNALRRRAAAEPVPPPRHRSMGKVIGISCLGLLVLVLLLPIDPTSLQSQRVAALGRQRTLGQWQVWARNRTAVCGRKPSVCFRVKCPESCRKKVRTFPFSRAIWLTCQFWHSRSLSANVCFRHQDLPHDGQTAHLKGKLFMTFRPLHDRVLVRRIEAQEKTAGGIIIPDTAKEKPQEGEVVSVGSGARGDDGKVTPLDVKAGDKILFGKWSGSEVKLDGEDLIIMKESDVLGIVA